MNLFKKSKPMNLELQVLSAAIKFLHKHFKLDKDATLHFATDSSRHIMRGNVTTYIHIWSTDTDGDKVEVEYHYDKCSENWLPKFKRTGTTWEVDKDEMI